MIKKIITERENLLKNNSGQAALIMVLVILGVLVIVIASIGFLTYNDLKTVGNSVSSSQSYYVAEAGMEDALLRVVNKMTYPSSYSLNVGNGSTQVTVSGPLSALVVTSKGNVDNRFRRVEVDLGTNQSSTNVAFNYGVQVGYGGLSLSNNSGINGNVYSNGPITGGNGSFVTGTAISANSPAVAADQLNDSPVSPPSLITFGNVAASQDTAQSFQVSADNVINNVQLYIRKVSTPGNVTVRITNDNSGNPGSTTFASGTLNASLVTGSYGWVTVNFTTNPQLLAGVTYWLVLDGVTNATRYYQWGANTAYSSGQAKTGTYSAGPWTVTSSDGYFRLYMGGLTGSIDGVTIGTGVTGDARAHSVTNATIIGNNYCQVGSGNNKACNTSQADPTAQTLPISDANVTQWKADATAGGTISGNYTPLTGTSNLGPTEITGDFTTTNNQIVTIQGTVWVHGNMSFSNNTTIKLDPGYGATSGIIIADGYINLSNNVSFIGSGQAGSYVMLLTTNDCNGIGSPTGKTCISSNSAMTMSNNSASVILYTTDGQMEFGNNAGANQATAYKLSLSNNATITYQTGLANTNFSSGPGGGFSIKSWKEIE